MKKLLAFTLGLALLAPVGTSAAAERFVGITREMPSEQEVRSYWYNYRSRSSKTNYFVGVNLLSSDGNLNDAATYQVIPNPQAGIRGQLSQDAVDDSLHVINTYRYMSGLGEVSENPALSSLAQATAAVSYLNNGIDHYPSTPAGFSSDDPMVVDGKQGASKSNLALGSVTAFNFIKQYMDDLGRNNLDSVGHRRWILAPASREVGVGYVGKFHALHVINKGQEDWDNTEVVAYPGANFMTEFIDPEAPFSILFGAGSKIDLSNAQVKVTDPNSGASKVYSYGNGLVASKASYGYSEALIFGGKLYKKPHRKYLIEVTGLTKDGVSYPIIYTTSFFRGGKPIDYTKLDERINELKSMEKGDIGDNNYIKHQKVIESLEKVKAEDSESQQAIDSITHQAYVAMREIIESSPNYQRRKDLVARLRKAIDRARSNVYDVEESLYTRYYDKQTRETLQFLVNKQKSNIDKIAKYANRLEKKFKLI